MTVPYPYEETGNDWGWVKKGSDWLSIPDEVCTCGAASFPCAHDDWLTANVDSDSDAEESG